MQMQPFDPHSDVAISYGKLPHWSQPGTACFMTWRLGDSLPEVVLQRFRRERARLLRTYNLDTNANWQAAIGKLPHAVAGQLRWALFECWDEGLDEGHGACWLKRPDAAQIVAESLLYADGESYLVSDFIVLPNHVHLIAAFADDEGLRRPCESWKRHSATRINRLVGRSGEFWQVEAFDHLIRSPEGFDYYRQYIANHPRCAKLPPGSYLHYSKVGEDLRDSP